MAEEALQLDQLAKVYHVMITVGEMCRDRGYDVPTAWCPNSLEDFRRRFCPSGTAILRDDMFLFCKRETDGGDALFVFFNGEASVNTNRVKEYVTRATNEAGTSIILVGSGKLNPPTRKFVEELPRSTVGVNFQWFDEDDLVVNITKHELVPKHTPLSKQEADDVLKAFSLEMAMLPRILSRDPIAQYYGMKKGQMFRITRRSETAGEYTTYRQVM